MTDLEIAQKLVDVFDERSEGSESGLILCPHAAAGVAYVAVKVLDRIIWDNEDECSPPEDELDTFESALAHCESEICDMVSALQALVTDRLPIEYFTIIVNDKEYKTAAKALTFEDIIYLAFNDTLLSVDQGMYTVAFRKTKERKAIPDRTMSPTDIVQNENGLSFKATRTGDVK